MIHKDYLKGIWNNEHDGNSMGIMGEIMEFEMDGQMTIGSTRRPIAVGFVGCSVMVEK